MPRSARATAASSRHNNFTSSPRSTSGLTSGWRSHLRESPTLSPASMMPHQAGSNSVPRSRCLVASTAVHRSNNRLNAATCRGSLLSESLGDLISKAQSWSPTAERSTRSCDAGTQNSSISTDVAPAASSATAQSCSRMTFSLLFTRLRTESAPSPNEAYGSRPRIESTWHDCALVARNTAQKDKVGRLKLGGILARHGLRITQWQRKLSQSSCPRRGCSAQATSQFGVPQSQPDRRRQRRQRAGG
jgi:hypothetical protein